MREGGSSSVAPVHNNVGQDIEKNCHAERSLPTQPVPQVLGLKDAHTGQQAESGGYKNRSRSRKKAGLELDPPLQLVHATDPSRNALNIQQARHQRCQCDCRLQQPAPILMVLQQPACQCGYRHRHERPGIQLYVAPKRIMSSRPNRFRKNRRIHKGTCKACLSGCQGCIYSAFDMGPVLTRSASDPLLVRKQTADPR